MDSRERRRLRRGLARRGLEPLSARLIALDEKRRAAITRSEQAQARRNAASKEIGAAKAKKDEATRAGADGGSGRAQGDHAGARRRGEGARRGARQGAGADSELAGSTMCRTARTSTTMSSISSSAQKRDYAFKPKEHFDLGEALGHDGFRDSPPNCPARGLSCCRRGWRGWSARSASSCSTCTPSEHGYTEVNPPLLVRDEAMFGTAQLPKFRDDQFRVTRRHKRDSWSLRRYDRASK